MCGGDLWFCGHWRFGIFDLTERLRVKPLKSQARKSTGGRGAETNAQLMEPGGGETFRLTWHKEHISRFNVKSHNIRTIKSLYRIVKLQRRIPNKAVGLFKSLILISFSGPKGPS